jgi:hypothetical protein
MPLLIMPQLEGHLQSCGIIDEIAAPMMMQIVPLRGVLGMLGVQDGDINAKLAVLSEIRIAKFRAYFHQRPRPQPCKQ